MLDLPVSFLRCSWESSENGSVLNNLVKAVSLQLRLAGCRWEQRMGCLGAICFSIDLGEGMEREIECLFLQFSGSWTVLFCATLKRLSLYHYFCIKMVSDIISHCVYVF